MIRVGAAQILAFRARATHLHERLARTSLVEAARGGLQDSAPRAAVISLHARVRDVEPSAWEDPALAQIWGPRGADYVIPREDLAVFTLGRMPRDPDAQAGLERIADDVHRVLEGRTREPRVVDEALPHLGHSTRAAAITGRVLIRWDASRIWLIPAERPEADAEEARLELARRFLRWLGPQTKDRFTWWSGVDPKDATATWRALSGELAGVEVEGVKRFVLESDRQALVGAEPLRGVRLIPHSDPYIKTDGHLAVEDEAKRFEVFPQPKVKPDFWPVSGAVVVDGRIVGSWARQQRRVTVNPWEPMDPRTKGEVEQEALTIPVAASSRPQVRWAV
ncbi:MAG TPA: crosslink repair DNA glycosylase YcaQ family protein [Actinomycetota bacterium]|nr:crosslink repair DNA glycosylase YcaQ family protein [Actinomycetota bacterium]